MKTRNIMFGSGRRCFLLDEDEIKKDAKNVENKAKEAGSKVEDSAQEGWNKLKRKF
jgi:hypothetical protein